MLFLAEIPSQSFIISYLCFTSLSFPWPRLFHHRLFPVRCFSQFIYFSRLSLLITFGHKVFWAFQIGMKCFWIIRDPITVCLCYSVRFAEDGKHEGELIPGRDNGLNMDFIYY